MSADQLVQFLAQALFVLIFLVVALKAVLRPWRANLDIALLFGVAGALIAESGVINALDIHAGPLLIALSSSLIIALPYLLLRLVDDFVELPPRLLDGAGLGLLISVVTLFLLPTTRPLPLTLAYVLYFVGFTGYVSVAFVRAARTSQGVTRRRMQAAAAGSLFLSLDIVWAGVQAALPNAHLSVPSDLFGLACGICYFIGFATPRWLRRTWQEPAVRAFLRRATALSRLPRREDVVRELELSLGMAFGTRGANIGIYDQEAGTLCYRAGEQPFVTPADHLIAGRAFVAQRIVFSANAAADDPAYAEIYARSSARSVLAAPLTAGEHRFGVLAIYAPRTPIFADDDLELVGLLAGQAAAVLENHMLIGEAAAVRAREEAAQLKDEFLAAAAHDLKTPLTALVAQAQLMEKRARRNPEAPADMEGIGRLVKETQRLKRLVLELLDVTRIQQGQLVTQRTPVDLATVLREACERQTSASHRMVLEQMTAITGAFDEQRIMQLIDNLIENAVKYTPGGGDIRLALWQEGDTAHLSVTDPGIGIPAEDLPHLFDRFHRGSNVVQSEAPGLGLGLFICRGIVAQHGGSISATSGGPGQGSTFLVTLPLVPMPPQDVVMAAAPSADGHLAQDGRVRA
jgi:signal transduction histidine kinase